MTLIRRFSFLAVAVALVIGFGFSAQDAKALCTPDTEGGRPPTITAMSVSLSGDQNTLTVNYTVNAGGGCDGTLGDMYEIGMTSNITGTGLTDHNAHGPASGLGVGLTGSHTIGIGSLANGSYTVVLTADNSNDPNDTESRPFTINRPITAYTMTVNKTGSGAGTVTGDPAGNGNDDIDCGSNCVAPFNSGTSVGLTAAPAAGSVFAGWSNCKTSANTGISVTMNSNKTCTAKFDTAPVTHYACNAGGSCVVNSAGSFTTSNCNNTCVPPTHYACNAAGSCVADSAGPYTTSNCNDACVPPDVQHYACNAAGSCVADSAGPYTTSNCNNTCVPPPTHYACNAAGTACVVSAAGPYTTSNCNNACTGPVGPYTLDVTLSGIGSGSVTGNPAGIGGDDINCGTDCEASFNSGANVTLTATADPGSIFDGWSNCKSSFLDTISVTMNADKTCTAHFDQGCTTASAITVTSNRPTTWSITGPEAFYQGPGTATGATYSAHTQGSYTITPANLAGYTRVVTPAATQAIASCGQGINYTITYTANPPDTHYACNAGGACVVTEGGPYTTSNCDNACVIAPPVRYACNSAGSCVSDPAGAYTSSNCNDACGGNNSDTRYTCNSNGSCVESPTGAYATSNCDNACVAVTHYACNAGGACVVNANGPYTTSNCNNVCSAVVPASCTFGASPVIISIGGSSTLTWECAGVTSCTVTNLATNATVASNGPDGQVVVSPASTTVYGLNCANGPFSTSTTVRVLTVQECNPGDPNCNP